MILTTDALKDKMARLALAIQRAGGDHAGDVDTLHHDLIDIMTALRDTRVERDQLVDQADTIKSLREEIVLLREEADTTKDLLEEIALLREERAKLTTERDEARQTHHEACWKTGLKLLSERDQARQERDAILAERASVVTKKVDVPVDAFGRTISDDVIFKIVSRALFGAGPGVVMNHIHGAFNNLQHSRSFDDAIYLAGHVMRYAWEQGGTEASRAGGASREDSHS